MSDKDFGNYVGLVINDNDPENRGRVQIFIPHLSNTLYSGWNDQLQDISFKSFETQAGGGFTNDIASRLYNLLPWSEGAVPFFGGGTSGIVHPTIGASIPNPQSKALQVQQKDAPTTTTNNPPNQTITPVVNPNANANADIKSITSTQNLHAYIQKAIVNNQTADAVGNGVGIDLNGSPNSVALEGAGAAGGNPESSLKLKGGSEKGLNGVTDNFVAGPNNLIGYPVVVKNNKTGTTILSVIGDGNGQIADLNNNPSQNLFNSKGVVELSNHASVASGNGSFSMASGTASVQGNPDITATIITDGSIPRLTSNSTIDDYNKLYNNQLTQDQKNQIAAMDTANPNTTLTPSGQCVVGYSPNRSMVANAVSSFIKNGGANGFFSKPAIGSKVWVFFYGGDPQRPVYFGSPLEASGGNVAYQTS